MNSINKTARMAGLLYLLMTPLSILGIIYIPSLIVPGDPTATVNHILAHEFLFRLSMGSALLVQVIQIFVALLLYKILKPVNKDQAVLMVLLILIAVPIAMLNEVNNFAALLLAGGGSLPGFTADQVHALVPMFLEFHKYGINIASLFWGLWLFPMGYLVFKSGYIPGILGVLLIIIGLGYLMDFVTFSLFPNFHFMVGTYTGFLEILLPLWLLIKGVNVEQWKKRAIGPA
jgi:Domain of unknown function (DUF4386)